MTKKIEIQNKLENLGFCFLSFEEPNVGLAYKVKLKCVKNHIFITSPRYLLDARRISRPSKGCPRCAEQIFAKNSYDTGAKKLLADYTILDSRIVVGKGESQRPARYFKIQCNHGHIYEKSNTFVGDTCPKCNEKLFVGQERVRLIFETHFHKLFPSVRPYWMKSPKTGNNLELDGYCDELKIAFEYQGRQHYSNDTQFGGEHFAQSERDKFKIDLCRDLGVKLVQISQSRSYDSAKFLQSIINDCKKQGIDIGLCSVDFTQINTHASLDKKYNEFKIFVQSKNYKLNSTNLSTLQDKLNFECFEGHLFEMTGENFKYNYSSVNYAKEPCAICNYAKHTLKSVYDLSSCKKKAQELNYQLVSTEYVNINEPLDWICDKGHSLSKSYRQMLRNETGEYCIHCKELSLYPHRKPSMSGVINKVLTIEDCREFARKIGYSLISTDYKNINAPLEWVCNHGHNISKSYRMMLRNKTGKYCLVCK